MALITCKHCGKNISDTTDKCIHCGGEVKENIIPEKELSQSAPTFTHPTEQKADKTSSEENGTRFKKLSKKCQLDLEEEFLHSNKQILKYRRKGLEIEKFGTLAFFLITIGALLLKLQQYVIVKYFDGIVYERKWIETSQMFIVCFAFIWLLSLIMLFYCGISYRNKVKKVAYQKFFQKWLQDEKQIIYHPNLITNKEKQIFDDIDLENFKF